MTQSEQIDVPDALPSFIESSIENYDDDPEVLAAIRDFADDLKTVAEGADGPAVDDIRAKNSDGEIEEIKPGTDGWTYVTKKVKCGTDSCKCASGDESAMHGPYVYRVRRNGDDLEWDYVGKYVATDDAGVDAVADDNDAPNPDPAA